MDTKQRITAIDLILNNPANVLTTTSIDLLGTLKNSILADEDSVDEEEEDDKITCDNCDQEEERDEVFGVQEDDWSTPGYYMVCNKCLNSQDNTSPMCKKYTDSEALPDENGSCSLCGGNCCDEE